MFKKTKRKVIDVDEDGNVVSEKKVKTSVKLKKIPGVELSKYQKRIRRHVANINNPDFPNAYQRNFIVPSAAGSGKSWTLRMLVAVIKHYFPRATIIIIQFNTHIKDAMIRELGEIPGVTITTCHSCGNQVLRMNRLNSIVDKPKYYNLCKVVIEESFAEICSEDMESFDLSNDKGKESKSKLVRQLVSQLNEIVEMTMLTLTKTDAMSVKEMCFKHNISTKHEALYGLVATVIEAGMSQVRARRGVGFIDMIYCPTVMNLNFPQFDFVLTDEIQDFSASQVELISRHKKPDGYFGGFGDSRQSIMQWAGALPGAMDGMKKRFKARSMPLSICYRCPSKVLDLARLLVPDIENRPNCPEGIVEAVTVPQIISKATAGDYIICRLTAPLVSLCIEFIKHGIKAKVKGRDIAGKLSRLYNDVAELAGPLVKSVDDFIGYFNEWKQEEKARAIVKKISVRQMTIMSDTHSAISAIAEYVSRHSPYVTHNQIDIQIKNLFDDDIASNFITLSTIHKSKGLEADNIFILEAHNMPFNPPNKDAEGNIIPITPEDLQEELNIIYVAITRPKKALYVNGNGIRNYYDIAAHICRAKGITVPPSFTPEIVVDKSQGWRSVSDAKDNGDELEEY